MKKTLNSPIYKPYVKKTLSIKQKGRCFSCLKFFGELELTIDHFLPKAFFPKQRMETKIEKNKRRRERDSLDNLVLMCKLCNAEKADNKLKKDIEEAWEEFFTAIIIFNKNK